MTSEIIINQKNKYYVILYNRNGMDLKYIVPLYSIVHGVQIRFYDKKFDRFKLIPLSQCEISEQKSTISEEEEKNIKQLYLSKYDCKTRSDINEN